MALPHELWPSDTKCHFGNGYVASTGTWSDEMGIATAISQPTSGNRPTWNTSLAPSGRGVLVFNGLNQVLNNGGQIPSGALVAYPGSGCWVESFLVIGTSPPRTSDVYRIVDYDGWDTILQFFGSIYRYGATTDGNLTTSVWRVIIVHNVTTGIVTIYVNNVAQGDTGSTNAQVRTEWMAPKQIGGRGNLEELFEGTFGCYTLIQRSTFGSTEIAALDAAMNEWWTVSPGGGGSDITVTLAAPRAEEGRASVIMSPGSRVFSFSSPRGEEARAAAVAATTLAASMPAARAEQAGGTSSLVLGAVAATLAAPRAEERGAVGLLVPGGQTTALVGVGSSELVPSAAASATYQSALAPGATSELGGIVATSRGAISVALSAALAEERGGTVAAINGAGPAPIVVVLAAPRAEEAPSAHAGAWGVSSRTLPAPSAEERASSLSRLPGVLGALMPAARAEERGPAVSVAPSVVASMSAARAEERFATIATSMAGVIVSLSPGPREEQASAGSSLFVTVVNLPAPRREELGGSVSATVGEPPPPPTSIPFIVHASTVSRLFRAESVVGRLVTHRSTVGRIK